MAMRRPHTRNRQVEFLNALLALDQPIAAILKSKDIDPELFVRWLQQRPFRRRLDAVRRYLHRTRELHVEIAALHASVRLIQESKADANKEMGKSLAEFVRLARRVERRRAGKDDARDEAADPTSPIYHPNLPADEAEQLIRELDAEGPE